MNTLLKHNIEADLSKCSKKYGWTPNVQARFIFESMHDIEYLARFIAENPQSLPYFLKRLIVTNRVKTFKRVVSKIEADASPDLLKWLMVYAVGYSRFSVVDFLKDKADHDFTSLARIVGKWPCKSDRALSKTKSLVFERGLTEEMKKLSFSVKCNLFYIARAFNDDFMLYAANWSDPSKSLLSGPSPNEIRSVEQGMALFGYTHERVRNGSVWTHTREK